MQNISIKNIYWMLAYAFRTINEKNIEKLSSEEFDNIYELFAVMMTNELNKQIKRGLNKDYVSIEENTNVLKGKVLVQKTLRTSKKVNKEIVYDKVICEHDDYSVNNYLNQIVKTACIYLIRAKQIKEKKIVDKLKKALLYFDGIDEIDKKSINWNTIKYNKYNSSYRMLINISNLILDGLLINKKDGKIEFRNYIDDQKMHKLYEKFILEYYKYHYANLNPSVPQVEWDVEKNNDLLYLLPKMQTDITLYSNNKTLIIDAKYYSDMYQNNPLFDKEKFKSNNLYQIYTYVKNEDKNMTGNVIGMLMYVKTNKNDKQWVEYIMGKNKIVITNLDFSKDFDEVKKHLNMVAEKFINNEI